MNNLKKARLLAGKTQAETAKHICMTQNTYSNYELGKTEPTLDTLIKLADYFHITIDSLLGHQVPYLLDKSILSQEHQQLIEKIVLLTREQCTRVEAYIAGLLTAEDDKQKTINRLRGE